MTWWCNGRTLVWKSEGHGFESRGPRITFFFFFLPKNVFFCPLTNRLYCAVFTLLLTSTSQLQSYVLVPSRSVPSQSRPSSVPVPTQCRPILQSLKGQMSPNNVKEGGKKPLCFTKYIEVISHGIIQSYVGQTSLTWDRLVSPGTNHSHLRQTSLIWGRAVKCGTYQSHVTQGSIIWDRPVSSGTDQS